MNCLEFRRACLVDPLSRAPDYRDHAGRCPACHEFLHQQLGQEQCLRAALAVEPPPGLAARILLRQSFVRRTRLPLALAATVLLSVTTGLVGTALLRPVSLGTEVLAHIRAEPEHLASPAAEDAGKLAAVLQALGARIEGNPGEVRYAGVCRIGRNAGAHLVLRGERGPVTVLLLPGQKPDRPLRLHDHGLEGVLVPIEGGSVAYVGMAGEGIEGLAQRLQVRLHEPRV